VADVRRGGVDDAEVVAARASTAPIRAWPIDGEDTDIEPDASEPKLLLRREW